MNKLIFRKLFLDIFSFFLLSSLAITSIVWVIQGVNLLDIVSEQGHSLKVYFFYTSLNLPKIFSKLLIFTYFLTLFVVLVKYEENNEILVFWTNGIKKISFINFIGKISLIFLILQLVLNLLVVPYTQKLKQDYLKNSTIGFFPKLIKEKKFSSINKNLTIFIEKNEEDGYLKGIYIKEKLSNDESKIIIASKGKIINDKNSEDFMFKLIDGSITNIGEKGTINLKFKETIYELSNLFKKNKQPDKLNETKSLSLFLCLEKNINKRKDEKIRCEKENSFLIKDIYEEVFKRTINPSYIIILSLISSLIILKPKKTLLEKYYKYILFILGFGIILFSELSYKLISLSLLIEIIFIAFPILLILFFYLSLFIKSNFTIKHL
tara:strand:+ start:868 stop:2004 length:1137 start_codon:yes stop_codon:yes gene_type:complete